MHETALLFGSIFGGTAVIFGAFGAHLLKKRFNKEQLSNFETGVRYQMYHAIALLAIGLSAATPNEYLTNAVRFFILGTLLFSLSIYGLTISSAMKSKIKILGPITPIGGLFLVGGWVMLLVYFFSIKTQ
ncbi:DUF423 domain-containing protein [Flavobacterium sp. HSC-61S13]|uniref:DUF423 domain-containing protein n=1 Tax=Flavobacterium sp. HSC-61S13 TaxID=2910963 RepID=UPI00209FDCF9|nr:DUF423 domain-containing protein [Flavobacterium sp. HSC-61S13]MCP1995856.1 uncharacterized membrane protein YgdD (TMEM256/DUF423 family) [Flavobacterium sp. HSC-61S13]